MESKQPKMSRTRENLFASSQMQMKNREYMVLKSVKPEGSKTKMRTWKTMKTRFEDSSQVVVAIESWLFFSKTYMNENMLKTQKKMICVTRNKSRKKTQKMMKTKTEAEAKDED